MENISIVTVSQGDDKFTLLKEVIEKSNFFKSIESKFLSSLKEKKDFSIVIKPNLMMFTHKENPPTTYTDPELIEYLIDLIYEKGFNKIYLVEAQNLYGNWYENRTVKNVAKAAGLLPQKHGYEIIDLTEETVPYNYQGTLQNHPVGKVWKDADYRISFAKNKTHPSNLYTLTLKNVYGTLPMQDKGMEYHAKREWDEVAIDNLSNFPVHFGIIDAFYSADGLLGSKGTSLPKYTKMILASHNLIAVDLVAGKMMWVKPDNSVLTKLAIKRWGKPKIKLNGISRKYRHPNWDNLAIKGVISRFIFYIITKITGKRPQIPYLLSKTYFYRYLQEEVPEVWQKSMGILEESYFGFNIGGIISNGLAGDEMDTKLFPRKKKITKTILNNSLKNLEDILKNKKRRSQFYNDLYEDLFS